MGEIIEGTRRHYVGADADKDTIPAGGKAFGDSYHANDKGKQYYWNGTAWKTGLGYEYVPRAVAAVDFDQGDFTINGAGHVDGLDLSEETTPGLLPVGAVAAHLNLVIRATAANKIGYLWANATTKVENLLKLYTQVANIKVGEDAVINIDADRLMNYYFDVGITVIEVRVMGWFI